MLTRRSVLSWSEMEIPVNIADKLIAANAESAPADQELASLLDKALRFNGVRILDNVDLDRLPDLRSRAFVLGRRMLDRAEARAD